MIRKITSPKNPLIKQVLTLQTKSRERRKQQLIIIEGLKEISLAVKSNIEIEKVLFCPEILSMQNLEALIGSSENIDVYELSNDVFSKISYRETTGGVIVIAKTPNISLANLVVNSQSVFIILESVEKPGNLGAISRIADGANVDGIILCDSLTDIHNPNAIRSSLGCVFTSNVVSASYDDVIAWIKENSIISFAAELNASEFYHKTDLLGKIALVFGTEAFGLTEKWLKSTDKRIKIPMQGTIDSLNVSSSVAVLVYEAMRQRDFLV